MNVFDRLSAATFADGHHGSGVGRHVWYDNGVFVIAAGYEAQEIKKLLQHRETQAACFAPWVATFTLDRDEDAQRADIDVTFYKLTHKPDRNAASRMTATVTITPRGQLVVHWQDENVWRQTQAFADVNGHPRAFDRTVAAVMDAGGYRVLQAKYLASIRDRAHVGISSEYMAMLC